MTLGEFLVFFVIIPIIAVVGWILYLYTMLKYGDWIKAGKSKIVVITTGRDGLVRFIRGKTYGDFIDLGNPGKITVNPEYTYRFAGNTKNVIMFVYEPIGTNVPPDMTKWEKLEEKIKASLSPRRIDELATYKGLELLAGKKSGWNISIGTIIAIIAVVAIVLFILKAVV